MRSATKDCLNCLSAGSVSLTRQDMIKIRLTEGMSQLPFGWVCFSNMGGALDALGAIVCLNCLSAGSVSLTYGTAYVYPGCELGLNCLSAGSVSLTRTEYRMPQARHLCLNCLSAGSVSLTKCPICSGPMWDNVSIAFRLGLFL